MQEKRPDHRQELICINVDKVYDWIVKEKSFDLFPTEPFTFPGLTADDDTTGATVRCDVTPATDGTEPIVILDRDDRHFCIDGKNVVLQQLNIRKNFFVTLFLRLTDGRVFPSEPIPVSRCEHVTLCAPDGTNVEVTYTELHCSICSLGGFTADPTDPTLITFSGLTISVNTCQSIQSTFPVTVEFLAEYCEPREDLPTVCPPPMRPKQCSVLFPDGSHGGGKCCQ